jgi:hypothetical protein
MAIRNVKALGLMVVAALSVTALIDATALANTGTGVFTCGKTPSTHTACILHGAQFGTAAENYFEPVGGMQILCENAGVTYTANATGTNKDVPVTPHYKDCTSEGLPATVNVNGCTGTITQPTTTGVGAQYDGTVDIVCPVGMSIDIEVFLFGTPTGSHSVNVCTVKILPKNGLTSTVAEVGTSGGKDDIVVKTNITNIKYERTGSCGTASGESGKLASTVTWTAKNAANEPDDVWLSD